MERDPVRLINPKSKSVLAARDRIIALVDQNISLHSRLPAANTPHEQTSLTRQIDATTLQSTAKSIPSTA